MAPTSRVRLRLRASPTRAEASRRRVRRRTRGASRRGAPDDRGAVRVARRPPRGRGRPPTCSCSIPRPADQRRVVQRRVRRRHQADGGRRGDRQAADAGPRSPTEPSRMHGSDLEVRRPAPQRPAAAVLTAVFTEGRSHRGWWSGRTRRRPRAGRDGVLRRQARCAAGVCPRWCWSPPRRAIKPPTAAPASPSYIAPCPRPCSAPTVSSTIEATMTTDQRRA